MEVCQVRTPPNPSARVFEVDTSLVGTPHEWSVHEPSDPPPPWDGLLNGDEPVVSVQLDQHRCTVVCDADSDWDDDRIESITTWIESRGEPLEDQGDANPSKEDDPMKSYIRMVLDDEVVPYLRQHGGSLSLESWDSDTHTLNVHYQGACHGCPLAKTGTLRYIERVLKREVDPDITVQSNS